MKLKIWTIKDVAEVIDGCVLNKFDANIFIEGKRGLGKSTLADKILSKCKSVSYDPWKCIHYSRSDVLKNLAMKQRTAIWADELINVGFNRDFYDSEQKQLIKAINMYRDSENVFIGCVPFFCNLDKQLQNLCKLRFTVVRRGLAIIHKQIPAIYTYDPWDIKNNQKIESKWSLKGKKPRYSQLTTAIGMIKFGDLHPERRKIIDEIKRQKRNHTFNNQMDENIEHSMDKVFYTNLVKMLKEKKLTKEIFNQMCSVAGKPIQNVRTRVNQILVEDGSKLKIKDLLSFNNNTGGNGDDVFDFKG